MSTIDEYMFEQTIKQEEFVSSDDDLPFLDAKGFVEEEISDLLIGTQREFHVEDEASADWVVNKIREWQREIEERETAFASTKRKLQRKIDWFKDRFTPELEAYALSVLAKRNKGGAPVKSIMLPCGAKLGHRLNKAYVKVVDQSAYELWVITNFPDAVSNYQVIIDKRAVTERALSNNIAPDGTQIVVDQDKFYITI